MKRNSNLKKRMLRREKIRKLKNKMKKSTSLLAIVVMVTSLINPQLLVYATLTKNTDQIIKNEVEYIEDYSKASIEFDVNSIDKETYELISIISDKEGSVIYDNNTVTEENRSEIVRYEAIENGSYSFTVNYMEKQQEVVEEAIEENKKEIDEEVDIEENADVEDNTTSIVTEGLDEKQEEHKVADTTIVHETKIIVEVSEIKEINATESVVNNKNETEEAESRASDTVIDLRRMFNVSGNVRTRGGEIKSLSDENISDNPAEIDDKYAWYIDKNRIKVGNKEDKTYPIQTIALTSKNSFDYERGFELCLSVKMPSEIVPEGIAIALHNTPNYQAVNGAGSLGVYRDIREAEAKKNGIKYGIVTEIDSFNNGNSYSDNSSEQSDDPYGQPVPVTGPHIALNETNDLGIISQTSIKSIDLSSMANTETDIKLKWESGRKRLQVFVKNSDIDISFERILSGKILESLMESDGYYTISVGINQEYVNDNNEGAIEISLKSYKYLDYEPEIVTSISEKDSANEYGIFGGVVTVKHEIMNSKESDVEYKDKLWLSDLKIDESETNLDISNIRVGTDKNNLTTVDKFDSSNPLEVTYPAHKGKYYVEYDVSIQEKAYGEPSGQLSCEVLLGTKGMEQIRSTASIDIINKPAIYTKNDSANLENSEVIQVIGVDEVTKALLWKDLFVKVEGVEEKLDIEQAEYMGKNVTWEYYVNGVKTETFPDSISERNMYSMKVTVTDERDSRLSDEFTRFIVIGESVEPEGYYIFAEDLDPISETKLITMTKDEFEEYVKEKSKVKAVKIDFETGTVEDKEVEVDTEGWLNSEGTYAYRLPGNGQIKMYIAEKNDVYINVNQEVTANTWSYNNPKLPIENGVSGFIIIPKGVDLEKGTGEDEDNLVGECGVYFAYSENANDVKYTLSVDKTFSLTKVGEESNSIEVTTSSSTEGVEENNKIKFENFTNAYSESSPLKLKFTASKEKATESKGVWKGKVNFYFERKS